jgi:hypothetical protein
MRPLPDPEPRVCPLHGENCDHYLRGQQAASVVRRLAAEAREEEEED